MPPMPQTPLTRILLIAATLAAAGFLASSLAQQDAWTDWSTAPADESWQLWVDPHAGFALELPPGHELAASDGQWFVHGRLGDEPLVPDLAIRFSAGLDLATALRQNWPAGAIAEPWLFADASTRGLRVVHRYQGPEGTPFTQAGYLIEGEVDGVAGVFHISRYESFDWAPFHAVASSFRHARSAGGNR